MNEGIQAVCGHCDSVVRLPGDRVRDTPRCPKCHFPLFEGKPIELREANFERHLTRNDLPLVVDFWAPWCGPCIAMAPFYEATARQLEPKLRFAKLNTQDEPAPAALSPTMRARRDSDAEVHFERARNQRPPPGPR